LTFFAKNDIRIKKSNFIHLRGYYFKSLIFR